MKIKNTISWILRLTVSVIFLQTLYYKFTAHPDSVHIFSALGLEPWGRIGLGFVELITSVLILFNKTKIIGMLTSIGIIVGAVFSHILVLGVNVSNDGGGLFTLAIIVLVASIIFLFVNEKEIVPTLKKVIRK
jgi:hypothetical protein